MTKSLVLCKIIIQLIFRFYFTFSRNQLWTVMEWRSKNRLTPSLSRAWGNPDRHIWPDFNAVSNVNFNSTVRFRWIFVAFLSWNLLFLLKLAFSQLVFPSKVFRYGNSRKKKLWQHFEPNIDTSLFWIKSNFKIQFRFLSHACMGLFFLQCNDAPWNIIVGLKLVSKVDTMYVVVCRAKTWKLASFIKKSCPLGRALPLPLARCRQLAVFWQENFLEVCLFGFIFIYFSFQAIESSALMVNQSAASHMPKLSF